MDPCQVMGVWGSSWSLGTTTSFALCPTFATPVSASPDHIPWVWPSRMGSTVTWGAWPEPAKQVHLPYPLHSKACPCGWEGSKGMRDEWSARTTQDRNNYCCFFGSHTLPCLELTSSSMLRSLERLRDHMEFWKSNPGWLYSTQTP